MDRMNKERRELEHELHTTIVPGTEIMADVGSHRFIKNQRSSTVLIPQPSDDPHDPLNWNRFWKFTTLTSTLLVAFAQTFGPLAIAPIFPQLIMEFDSDLNGVAQFTGITILVLGFSNFVWVPLSSTFGRRFVFLLSTLISIASMVWRAEAKSYSSFMGAAVLAGIGTGPGETIPPAIITDVVFLHERGFYNTLYFSTFFSAVMLGPIIQGSMADGVGWRSFWWLNVALHSCIFIVLLVALPETKWDRVVMSSKAKPEVRATDLVEEKQNTDASSDALEDPSPSAHHNGPLSESNPSTQDKHLGKGHPSPHQWQGFQTSPRPFGTLLQAFYLPWRLFTYPIVVFAALIVGFSSGFYLMVSLVQSQAFSAPPYGFTPQSVGFTNFASLVGAIIGLLTAGPLSDWVSAKLTDRNRGIREPEMRLVAIIPYLLIMILGNFITGFGLQYGWDWRAIVIIGFGCAGIQVAALPAIASTYAVDSYKPAAGSIFVAATISKNLWGYGEAKFTNEWVELTGYVPPFMTSMCLISLWCFCGIIFWVWGKTFRKWTAGSSIHNL